VKILAVDDVALIRKMMRRAVEALDGTLFEASNGIEAMAILKESAGNIDLILLDWNMPEMDGFEFLNHVKSNSKFKHIPVIMITTRNERDKIIKAIQAGASHYLVKPFTQQELAKRILECIGASEPLSNFFSRAVKEVFGAATGKEVVENDVVQAERTKEFHFCGEIIVLGRKNAVVFVTMDRATAAGIVASRTGKLPAELAGEELVDGLAEFINAVAVKAGVLANVLFSISTHLVFVGLVSESRLVFKETGIPAASKKFRAGELGIRLALLHY